MQDAVREFLRRLESGENQTDNEALVPHGRRPCPICGQPMGVEVEEGIHTDVCAAHGVWLDSGELAGIFARVRERLQLIQSLRERKSRSEGVMRGMSQGIWALLLDL